MPDPLLVTAADLAGREAGYRMVVPRGAIVTPAAKDYAGEHGIHIVSEDGVVLASGRRGWHDDAAGIIVKNILRELRRELGRVPTEDEAFQFVRAVVERARKAALDADDAFDN